MKNYWWCCLASSSLSIVHSSGFGCGLLLLLFTLLLEERRCPESLLLLLILGSGLGRRIFGGHIASRRFVAAALGNLTCRVVQLVAIHLSTLNEQEIR